MHAMWPNNTDLPLLLYSWTR